MELTKVFYKKTTTSFQISWDKFAQQYELHPAFEYVCNNWFQYCTKFVAAWTQVYTHFDTQVTSWVELMHCTIKRYIASSNCDLLEVKKQIGLLLCKQYAAFVAEVGCQRITTQHHLNINLFHNLLHKVSLYALEKVSGDLGERGYKYNTLGVFIIKWVHLSILITLLTLPILFLL